MSAASWARICPRNTTKERKDGTCEKSGQGVVLLCPGYRSRDLDAMRQTSKIQLAEKGYLRSKSKRINSAHYDCGVKMHSSGAGALHIVKGTTCIDLGAKVTRFVRERVSQDLSPPPPPPALHPVRCSHPEQRQR